MITVTLSESDAQHIEAVRQRVAEWEQYEPNLGGEEIAVEPGDFTAVDCDNEQIGASLLTSVIDCIQGSS